MGNLWESCAKPMGSHQGKGQIFTLIKFCCISKSRAPVNPWATPRAASNISIVITSPSVRAMLRAARCALRVGRTPAPVFGEDERAPRVPPSRLFAERPLRAISDIRGTSDDHLVGAIVIPRLSQPAKVLNPILNMVPTMVILFCSVESEKYITLLRRPEHDKIFIREGIGDITEEERQRP